MAWTAVAGRGAELGLDRRRLRAALADVAAAGSGRGGIIDEAVRVGRWSHRSWCRSWSRRSTPSARAG